MDNRIRLIVFTALAMMSASLFGAGATRFGLMRNSDWVVTNAWQAVSNRTHDLIVSIGGEASLPPNWSTVSNAAMNAVSNEDFGTATNDIYGALSDIKTDSITDGTNTIDAAGIVYTNDIQIGKLALTNDIPQVVPPSTNAVSGQAADAKATGTALYTGFTEWESYDLPSVFTLVSQTYSSGRWNVVIALQDGDLYPGYSFGLPDDTVSSFSVYVGSVFDYEIVDFSTSRHLVTPTKTSQLTNDGPPATDSNAGHPFATTNQIPDTTLYPVYKDGQKYSEWTFGTLPSGVAYVDGPTWQGDEGLNGGWALSVNGNVPIWDYSHGEDATSLSWEYDNDTITATRTLNPVVGYTLGNQSTKLLQPQGNYQTASPLSSHTYDFSTNVGLYTAVRDLIQALGGSVTNFPAINGGN